MKPEEIVENMLQAGAKKACLPVKQLLIRGFLAGAFLGYATIWLSWRQHRRGGC